MSFLRVILFCTALAALPAAAQNSAATYSRSEQIRHACISGRRCVCGRVLQVTPTGLVVDSGYASLLKPPFNHAWLTRANAAPAGPSVLAEGTAPDSIAVGVVFLTDIPRRQKARQYDYVALIGYPAGDYDYVPVPGVKKTIRRFAAGLEKAVKLTMQAGEH